MTCEDAPMTAQNFDQIVAFGKDNVEALVKSSTVAVKGIEELAKVYSTLANQSIEQTSSAVKALSTAKSPTEFQSIYTDIAKTNFESFVSESRKIQELANSIVTSSFAPLNARVQALSGIFKSA
jgi:phasin family protein